MELGVAQFMPVDHENVQLVVECTPRVTLCGEGGAVGFQLF